jgi:hypothetical protein
MDASRLFISKFAISLFVGLVLILGFATSALANDAHYVLPPGQESTLSSLFSFPSIKNIDRQRLSIQVESDSIMVLLPFDDGRPNLTLQLSHPSNACQGQRLTHWCAKFEWYQGKVDLPVQASIIKALETQSDSIRWIALSKPTHKPRENAAPEFEAPREKRFQAAVTDGASLSAAKIGVLVMTSFAWYLFFTFGLYLIVIGFINLPIKDRLAVIYWGLFALIIRTFLVAPVQHHYYADLIPTDWLIEFPSKGAAFPILQSALSFIGLTGSSPVFGLMILAGSLAVPLVYALARRLDFPGATPHLAALLLAISPLHVRLSAGDSPHILLMTVFIAAILVWRQTSVTRSYLGFLFVLSSILIIVQLRPEAIAVSPCLLLFTASWRKWPRSFWLVPPAIVGVGTILAVWIYYDVGAIAVVPSDSGSFRFERAAQILITLLGRGEYLSSTSLGAQYIYDSVLGAWPSVFSGTEMFRDASILQWTPAVLWPFYLIGIVKAFRTKRLWVLPALIIMLRLPAFLKTGLEGTLSGNLIFEARYYIGAYPVQILLVALGLVAVTNKLKERRVPRLVVSILAGMLMISVTGVCLWMYSFGYGFQDEIKAVNGWLPKIEKGARILFWTPSVYDGFSHELSADLSLSRLTMDRPDLIFEIIQPSELDEQLAKSDYYIELLNCRLEPDQYTSRTDEDTGSDRWQFYQVHFSQMYKRCADLREAVGEPIEHAVVRKMAFGAAFGVKPGYEWIYLYPIPNLLKTEMSSGR